MNPVLLPFAIFLVGSLVAFAYAVREVLHARYRGRVRKLNRTGRRAEWRKYCADHGDIDWATWIDGIDA